MLPTHGSIQGRQRCQRNAKPQHRTLQRQRRRDRRNQLQRSHLAEYRRRTDRSPSKRNPNSKGAIRCQEEVNAKELAESLARSHAKRSPSDSNQKRPPSSKRSAKPTTGATLSRFLLGWRNREYVRFSRCSKSTAQKLWAALRLYNCSPFENTRSELNQ